MIHEETAPVKITDGREVFLVAPWQIPEYSPLVYPHIQRVLEKSNEGDYDADFVLQRIADGAAQLWIVMDKKFTISTVIISEIANVNMSTYMRLWLTAGELEDYNMDVYRVIELWGLKNYGVSKVESLVRPGLAKHMVENLGFTEKQRRIVRAIPEAIH